MKKVMFLVTIMFALMIMLCPNTVKGVADEVLNNSGSASKLVELSEEQKDELAEYQELYESDTYGFTAFVLNKVRIFSIPFCFLGIVVSAIYQYVIGIRKLDVRYKGFYTMIAFITLFVICQVLPLVFLIVIKGFGRS